MDPFSRHALNVRHAELQELPSDRKQHLRELVLTGASLENEIDDVQFVELLIRNVIDDELSKAVILCDVLEFWRERSEKLSFKILNFLEMGPWHWYEKGWNGIKASVDSSCTAVNSKIRAIIMEIGRLQMHLSFMKQQCYGGQRDIWMHRALSLVLEHLRSSSMKSFTSSRDLDIDVPLQPKSDFIRKCGIEILEAASTFDDQVSSLLAEAKPLSPIRRCWFVFCFGLPVLSLSLHWAVTHRSQINSTVKQMKKSLGLFIAEHILEPSRAIYTELFFNSRQNVQDIDALNESIESLRRMLENFLQDKNPALNDAQIKALASDMDMSVVSREYEKSIVSAMRSIVTGDIIRMLLIQVQFMKTKLLLLLNSMEDLMDENEFNLRVMATVPAFVVFWITYKSLKFSVQWMGGVKSRTATGHALRATIVGMERLLNLRNSNLSVLLNSNNSSKRLLRRLSLYQQSFPQASGDPRQGGAEETHRFADLTPDPVDKVNVLDELDLGKLALLAHQVRKLVSSSGSRYHREDVQNLNEDLMELMGDRGIVTVGQQLSIVQRMMRTYSFLQPYNRSRFSLS